MDKCSRDQNTSTEVFAEEEDGWWDLHPLDLLRDDRESTTANGGYENND